MDNEKITSTLSKDKNLIPNDIMIDIETGGLNPGCVVFTFGARVFDRNGNIVENPFYMRIRKSSCLEVGLKCEDQTMSWWNKNFADDSIEKMEVFSEELERHNLKEVLLKFNDFFKEHNCKCVWAKGPDFDCVILKHAYNACNLNPPWKYNDLRDVRTVIDLDKCLLKVDKSYGHFKMSKNKLRESKNDEDTTNNKKVIHHALNDCDIQINQIIDFLMYVNITKDEML